MRSTKQTYTSALHISLVQKYGHSTYPNTVGRSSWFDASVIYAEADLKFKIKYNNEIK